MGSKHSVKSKKTRLRRYLLQKRPKFFAISRGRLVGQWNEYQKTVDEIYRTTLYRAADPVALSYYVPLLRENKITVDEIIQEILE